MFADHWLEVLIIGDIGRNGSNSSNPADMTLPVSIGPNRCELIYNHDKQPLLELSLRVCLPVKELLSVLSQLAPPVEAQVHKPSRSVAKVPPLEDKCKDQPTPPTGRQPIRKSQLLPAPLTGSLHTILGNRTHSRIGVYTCKEICSREETIKVGVHPCKRYVHTLLDRHRHHR